MGEEAVFGEQRGFQPDGHGWGNTGLVQLGMQSKDTQPKVPQTT